MSIRMLTNGNVVYNDTHQTFYIAYNVNNQARTAAHTIRSHNVFSSLQLLSSAINRTEHVYANVIIKHNYMLMCNHKIAINIMLCLLNSTGHACI